MKNIINLLLLSVSILTCGVCNAEHQDASGKSYVKDCNNVSFSQRCAKTISSVFDKQGRLWSAWTNGNFLYVNHSDDMGATFSQAVKVNVIAEKISAGHEHRPKIKVSNKGVVFLSWTRKLNKLFTGNIRFSKSIDKGKSFSAPITVNDKKETSSHRFDALGVNKRGDIYISWLDKRDSQKAIRAGKKYNGAAAYYAVSTDQGNSFSKNRKIADNSCECCRMALDFDVKGFPVIAWRNIYGENIRDHSIVNFKNRFEVNKPNRLSNDNWKINGCPHHGPSLSISNKNIYHAVWFNDAIKKHGIFYANSHDAGESFSKPLPIGRYENNASNADIVTFHNAVYIVWQEYTQSTYQLFGMKSEDNGISWNKAKHISTSLKKSDYPFLLIDNQQVYVSWHIPGRAYHLISVDL